MSALLQCVTCLTNSPGLKAQSLFALFFLIRLKPYDVLENHPIFSKDTGPEKILPFVYAIACNYGLSERGEHGGMTVRDKRFFFVSVT